MWSVIGSVIGSAIVLIFIALLFFGGHSGEPKSRPGYIEVPPRTTSPGAIGSLNQAFIESMSKVSWGSGSVRDWERRCQSSLYRSQARRSR